MLRANAENEFVALKKVRERHRPRQTSPPARKMFSRPQDAAQAAL